MAVYSQNLIKRAKGNKLNIEDLIFCILCADGFTQKDAYIAAYRPMTNNIQAIEKQLKRILKDENLQLYLFRLTEDKRKEDNNLIEFERKIRAEYQQEYKLQKEQSKEDATATEQPEQTTGNIPTQPATTRSKADIIKELNEKIDRCTDPREQREFYKMLIDVEQMKKDIDETEEESIHYYFPVSCKECQHNPDSKKASI